MISSVSECTSASNAYSTHLEIIKILKPKCRFMKELTVASESALGLLESREFSAEGISVWSPAYVRGELGSVISASGGG